MTTRNPRQERGTWGTAPPRLPQLQTARLADPQVQKAIEALREWVEVRLGSRGDAAERAVTQRELNRLLEDVIAKTTQLKAFTGDIITLRGAPQAALPETVYPGAFVPLENGELYFGSTLGWKKVTLT
jgi:hypothetical protein